MTSTYPVWPWFRFYNWYFPYFLKSVSKPFLYIFVILYFVSLNEITESDFCMLNLRLYLQRHHFESQISSSELKRIFQLTKWRFKFSYRITKKSLTTAKVVTNKRWNSIPFFRPNEHFILNWLWPLCRWKLLKNVH